MIGRPGADQRPGHVAFWFGWYAFFPHTEDYASAHSGGVRQHEVDFEGSP